MIQDKDFTLRLIRQISQALEKLLVCKPEESLMQKELDFDSLMKDIFKIKFSEISIKSKEEIKKMIDSKDSKDQSNYFEMLGNLFMYHYKMDNNIENAKKALFFYELYLSTSGIFDLPIVNRINQLNVEIK